MYGLSNVHMTAAKRLSVHRHAIEVSSNRPHAEGAPELVLQTVAVILSLLQPGLDEQALLITRLLIAVNILVLHQLNSKGSNSKREKSCQDQEGKGQNHSRIKNTKVNL
jgi:hypothetical protein